MTHCVEIWYFRTFYGDEQVSDFQARLLGIYFLKGLPLDLVERLEIALSLLLLC